MSLSMRTLTMKSVISRRSTGSGGVTDGEVTKFKTKFETEVNLNIGLKPILVSRLSTGLKLKFKT